MSRNIQIQAKNETVNIYLYGYIDAWEVSGKKLVDQITQYDGNYKKCNIYINSNGGDVAEGIALFNILSRTQMELSIHVDGVAASMAAVLVQVPNAKRYMSKYAKLMLHAVSGGNWGSAEELRQTADMMEDFQESLVNMVAVRTGLSADDVKSKWFDGKDHWYNADQALAEKLIDEIEEGKVNEAPANLNNLTDVIDFYEKQIVNYNQNFDTMKFENVNKVQGFENVQNEDQLLAAITAQAKKVTDLSAEIDTLKTKKADLEKQVGDAKEAKITDMVDAAVQAKKITEGEKETYVALAKADFDNTKKILDSKKGFTGIGSQIDPEDNSPIKLTDEQKKWGYKDFQKTPEGTKLLSQIREKDPQMFANLYKDAFGKEPK